jgi:hypothetical protein
MLTYRFAADTPADCGGDRFTDPLCRDGTQREPFKNDVPVLRVEFLKGSGEDAGLGC